MCGSGYSARRQPFVYLASALIAGILIEDMARLAPWAIILALGAGLAVGAWFFLTARDEAASAALLLAVAAAGALLGFAERSGVAESRLKLLFAKQVITAEDPVYLCGTLSVPPEPAPGAFYIDIDAESLVVGGHRVRASGGARLVIDVEDPLSRTEFESLALDYGSQMRALVRLERARSYLNPGSPDFSEFLDRQGFDLTGVIKSPLLIESMGKGNVMPLLGWLYRFRLGLMEAIDARFNPEVAGTLKAMLTGNRYFLDPKNADRLRESSAFHIISISGMHIGLIAWAMLGGWSPSKRRGSLHVLLVLVALWLYALMAGLQPPVTRATVMISVGLIGPLIFRKSASANTVALAAFIMLALKPALVADPGFQLSFIAVAAIVAIAVPLAQKLRQVGEWKPGARTPHPPSCSRFLRYFAESLFWNERSFRAGMRRSSVQYRLDKAAASRSLILWLAQPVLRWVLILLITSTAIQVATLPLSVLYFNRIAPIGIPINVLSGALTAVMMLGAVASVSLGALLPWLSSHLEPIVNTAHRLLVDSARPFTEIPGATFRAPHFEDWRAATYLAYFGLLAGLILILERWRPVYMAEPGLRAQTRSSSHTDRAPRRNLGPGRAAAVCGLGLALCFGVIARPSAPGGDGRLAVHFLDVGQGDSALVVFPLGATMLIDAGGEIRPGRGRARPSASAEESDPGYSERLEEASDDEAGSFIGEMVVSRFLWSLGLTRIDYAVITHADRDHIGGFSEVIRNFGVGQIVVGSGVNGDSAFRSFADLISDRGIPAAQVSAGESFQIEGVTLEVLWPPQTAHAKGWSSNDRSIVIRLVYGSVALLLTGDIERGAEAALLRSGNDLRADLLKVPHHGSNTSSSEAFLEAVRPARAVISVGERSVFGHPHEAVVSRFLQRGITLYRTGRDGTVSVRTDGASLEINLYKGP